MSKTIEQLQYRDHLLTMKQVACLTNRSESSIRRDIANGLFPRPRRIGERSVRFLESDVMTWLANLSEAA